MTDVHSLLKKHEEMIAESLPLIASENVTSIAVRVCLLSDFGHRYAMGEVGDRVYSGCKYIDEIEELAVKLTKKLFNCNYVNVRPISGTVANLAVYGALANLGDKIAATPVKFGGHTSHFDTASIRGLKSLSLPFDLENFTVDVEKAERLIRKEKPKIVMLGASVILFSHPLELKEVCDEVNAHLVYDASHVLGLIAGKVFQNPLDAEVVTASTHKTFPGPQRAVIFGNTEKGREIDRAVMPGVVSNHHLNSLAAYAVACMEMLEFGKDYAKQTVKNAKTLAEELYSLGFKVLGESRGFTETHQVVFEGGEREQRLLERNGIFVNVWPSTELIRLGVQELTRRGMKEEEMKAVAELIDKAVKGKNVREDVKELASSFREVHYTFKAEKAYVPEIFERFENAGIFGI